MLLSSESAMTALNDDTALLNLTFHQAVRGPYCVASVEPLPDDLATKIMQLVRSGIESQPKGVLSGRGKTAVYEFQPYGRVFVKNYAHGGLLRAITGGKFLGLGSVRSQREFEMLEFVRSLGVHAPKPYVYVTCGSMIYRTWLLMEEIPDTVSLVEVSKSDPDAVLDAMKKLSDQLLVLIKHRVLHVDLHPGNVLVDSSGEVFIVDFDKAHIFHGSSAALRDLYLRRWRRAVIKHGLSPLLTELMSLTLRSYDE
jgi:3-deoxy-D-manno-octulosonic acid kinase